MVTGPQLAIERDRPFIWVTWLKGLIAGDDNCEFQPWYKTHHKDYPKMPNDFNSVEWNTNHTRLLRHAREEYRQDADEISLEGQMKFYVDWPFGVSQGSYQTLGTISGQPDLGIVNGDTFTIIDAKTGKPRTSDRVQVLLYMYLLPMNRLDGRVYGGVLYYPDHTETVPPSMLTASFKESVDFWLDLLLSESSLEKFPSKSECNFCNIASCDRRVEND